MIKEIPSAEKQHRHCFYNYGFKITIVAALFGKLFGWVFGR